jgi:hypothetical protein
VSNIQSSEEAMQQIANALNFLEEHFEEPTVETIRTDSARIAFDPDAGKWFVEKYVRKVKEND